MASNVVYEVLAGKAHHVVNHVIYEVFRGVPPIALPHVAVDGGKTFASRATAFDGGFFRQHHALVASSPILGLKSGAAARHSPADNQYVAIYSFCGLKSHGCFLPGYGCAWLRMRTLLDGAEKFLPPRVGDRAHHRRKAEGGNWNYLLGCRHRQAVNAQPVRVSRQVLSAQVCLTVFRESLVGHH